MSVEEDIEAAERATREPARTRRLRRAGGGLALIAVGLCLLAMFGDRWWVLELDRMHVYVGASDTRVCMHDGACEELRHHLFVQAVVNASNGTASASDVESWLGGNSVTVMLGFVIVSAGGLGGLSLLSSRHKGTRVLAITAGVLAVMAFIPVGRFFRAAPLAELQRGIHAYVGIAGIVAAIAAALLVAVPRALVTPPTARVVRR